MKSWLEIRVGGGLCKVGYQQKQKRSLGIGFISIDYGQARSRLRMRMGDDDSCYIKCSRTVNK